MQINELKNKIKNKNIPKLMIFVGSELFVKKFYLNKISNHWNKLNSYETVKSSAFLHGLFYLIDGQSLLDTKSTDWLSVKNKLASGSNTFVFMISEEQELSKEFIEVFKDHIINFDPLNRRFLYKYFKDYELDNRYMDELINRNGGDYTRVKTELEKIKHYSISNKLSNNISYNILEKQEVLYKPLGDYIFNLTGAILEGKIAEIDYWLLKVKETGEHPLNIVSTLTKNFKEIYYLLQAEKTSNASLKSKLNLSKGKIWVLSKQKNVYSIQEIERNIRWLQFIESGFKTGIVPAEIALDLLIINIVS